MIVHADCIGYMDKMIKENIVVDFTLTDIPYDAVNRDSGGLRVLDKDKADIMTFDLSDFLERVYELTTNSIVIFCDWGQFSTIADFFRDKAGTIRPIVWEKRNPSPMNGQHVYLSGVELAVWFKKRGAKTFNAHCKNTVFKHPNGTSKLHPTEKNHMLLAELIMDNTNIGDTVFDPCCGSGSHLLVAKKLGRNYLGVELNKAYYDMAVGRVNSIEKSLFL